MVVEDILAVVSLVVYLSTLSSLAVVTLLLIGALVFLLPLRSEGEENSQK